jgi:hypothetical protein
MRTSFSPSAARASAERLQIAHTDDLKRLAHTRRAAVRFCLSFPRQFSFPFSLATKETNDLNNKLRFPLRFLATSCPLIPASTSTASTSRSLFDHLSTRSLRPPVHDRRPNFLILVFSDPKLSSSKRGTSREGVESRRGSGLCVEKETGEDAPGGTFPGKRGSTRRARKSGRVRRRRRRRLRDRPSLALTTCLARIGRRRGKERKERKRESEKRRRKLTNLNLHPRRKRLQLLLQPLHETRNQRRSPRNDDVRKEGRLKVWVDLDERVTD